MKLNKQNIQFSAKNHLNFGSWVTISLSQLPEVFTSDGFIDLNIVLQSSNQTINIDRGNHSNVFCIIPPHSFIEKEKFLNLFDKSIKIQGQNADIQKKLQIQYLKMENEMNQNQEKSNILLNTPLFFDQEFQLQHIKSHKFLSFNPSSSSSASQNSYLIQLSEKSDEYSVFEICPCYKYQTQITDYISFEDDIFIRTANKDFNKGGFIAHQEFENLDMNSQKNNLAVNNILSRQLTIKNIQLQNDRVVLCFDRKSKFQFKLYRQSEEDEFQIYKGDCIQIIHPECESCIQYTKQDDFHLQKQQIDYNNPVGIWVVEGLDNLDGGKLQFEQVIRIKNLVSNKYMLVNNNNIGLSHLIDKENNFMLVKVNDQQLSKNLDSRSVFHLKHIETGLYFSILGDQNKISLIQYQSQEDAFKFIKISKNEIWESQFLISNTLTIKSCQDSIRSITQFLSLQPEDQQAITHNQVIRNRIQGIQNDKEILLLGDCLQMLNKFCSDFSFGLNQQVLVSDQLKIFQRRQNILNQQGYIQLLAQILEACFPGERALINLKKGIGEQSEIFILEELEKIVNLCYEVLKQICKNNVVNKNECFKNIHYFFHHIGYINGAIQCLNECFKDNQYLLYNLMEKSLTQLNIYQEEETKESYYDQFQDKFTSEQLKLQGIQGFSPIQFKETNIIQLLINKFLKLDLIKFQQRQSLLEFIDFMTKICTYREFGININQEQINIFLWSTNYQKFFATYSLEQIKQYYSISENLKLGEKTLEIQKYLLLYSQICYGRNYKTLRSILPMFPIEELVNLIMTENDVIPIEIKSALIKIFLHVHVDFKPQLEHIIPMLTKEYNINIYKSEFYFIDDIERTFSLDSEQKQQKQIQIDNNLPPRKTLTNELLSVSKQQRKRIIQNMIDHILSQLNAFSQKEKFLCKDLLIVSRKLIQFNFFNFELQDLNTNQQLIDLILSITKYKNNLIQEIKQKQKHFYRYNTLSNNKNTTSFQFFQSIEQKKKLENEQLNQINNEIFIEICRNTLLILDIKHDYYLSKIVEFIKESNEIYQILVSSEHRDSNEIQKYKNFQDYLDKEFEKYLPNCESKTDELNLDNAFFFNQKFKKNCTPQSYQMSILYSDILLKVIPFTNNYCLTLLLFKLCFNLSKQRTNLIKNLQNLQILKQDDQLKVFQELSNIKTQLTFDCEQSEIWLDFPKVINQQGYQYTSIIQRVLYSLNRINDLFYSQNQGRITKKRSQILMNRQIMIRNLGIYKIVINLMNEIQHYIKGELSRTPQNELLFNIMESSYDLLIQFTCNNNIINKELISPYLEKFLQTIDHFNFGQTELITELFNNNKKMINSKVTEKLLMNFLNQILVNKRYHTRYIDFIFSILDYCGQPIKENWHMIINIFIQQKILQQILNFEKQEKNYFFNLDIENCSFDECQPYLYQSQLIDLFNRMMSYRSKQKQIIQAMVQDAINLQIMLSICTLPDIFTPQYQKGDVYELVLNYQLKLKILQLIKILYQETKLMKEIDQLQFLPIKFIISLELEKMKHSLKYQIFTIKFDEIYEINHFQDDLDIIQTGQIKQDKLTPRQEKFKLLFQNIDFSQIIIDIRYYQVVFVLPLLLSIQNSFREKQISYSQFFDENTNLQYFDQINEIISNLDENQLSLYPELINQLQFIDDINSQFIMPQSYIKLKEKNFKINEQKQNTSIVYKYPLQEILIQNQRQKDTISIEIIINLITNSYIEKRFIKDENQILINIFKAIHDKRQFDQIMIKLMGFVVDTINCNYLENDLLFQEKQIQIEVCISILHWLKQIVEEAQILGNIPYQDKDFNDFIDIINPKQEMQDKFERIGIVQKMISNMCTRNIQEDLFFAHIDLAISLLDEGNQKIQKSFYNYFITYNYSEILFERIQNQIDQENQNLKIKQNFNDLFLNSIQTLTDHQSNKHEANITRIFQFLQLLCEGHNQKLQVYLLFQENSRKNYNLLGLLVKISEKYFNNLSEHNYYKLIQCFDTINEMTQGPCFQNQKFLSESKLVNLIGKICEVQQLDDHKFSQNQKKVKNWQKIPSSNLHKKNGLIQLESLLATEFEDTFQHSDSVIYEMNNHNKEFGKLIESIVTQHEFCYDKWMLRRLHNKAIILLESMMEGNSDKQIVQKIIENISFRQLTENLYQIHNQYRQLFKLKYTDSAIKHFKRFRKRPKYSSELILESGFRIYGILKKYQEEIYSDQNENKTIDDILSIEVTKQELRRSYLNSIQYFEKHSGTVEIIFADKSYKVYFPRPPYCITQDKEYRLKFESQVDRSSRKQKLQGFLSSANDMITLMKFEKSIKEFKNGFIFAFLFQHIQLWRVLCFILSLIQNIAILFFVNARNNSFSIQLITQNRVNQNKSDEENQLDFTFLNTLLAIQIIQIFFSFVLLFTFTTARINKAKIDIKSWKKKEILTQYLHIGKIIIQDGTFYIRVGYFIFAIFGLFNYLFIAILLLDIFFKVPLLSSILKSIWRPKYQLILTIVIFLISQFLFSLIAYFFFPQDYQGDCDSLWNCFSMFFDVSFPQNAGYLGLFIPSIDQYISYAMNQKAIFDFLYNFFVLILIIRILSGLLIDTFAEIRIEQDYDGKDKENVCFICGLQKISADRLEKKLDFREHINQKHKMWNYLYYIAYIQDKNEIDYSGIESYVANCIKEKDVSWFPSTIEKHDYDNEKQQILSQDQSIIQLKHKIDSIEDKVDQLYKNKIENGQKFLSKIDENFTLIQQLYQKIY